MAVKRVDYDDAFMARLRERHRPTVARAISVLERGSPDAPALVDALCGSLGRAWRIGITGPPGAGKSTLTGALARHLSAAGASVGILAVDPSSPFTSGAVLGDRVRMVDLEADDRIYIRSMASRGVTGGVSAATREAADVLDAAGFDFVLIESVGVGQAELDVRYIVDTTTVVLVPESGDQVQAIKAGLMEIAEIYVLNKADRPDAATALNRINSALHYQHREDDDWRPAVLRTIASQDEGIAGLAAEITRHRQHLVSTGRLAGRRRQKTAALLRAAVEERLRAGLWQSDASSLLERGVNDVLSGSMSLRSAATAVLDGAALPGHITRPDEQP